MVDSSEREKDFFAKIDLLVLFPADFKKKKFLFLVRLAGGCTSDLERIHFVIKLIFSSHHAARGAGQGRCRGGENLFISSA